jgi:hypothetical protein
VRIARLPSFRHELILELFRQRGELACELLRSVEALPAEDFVSSRESADLSQLVPIQFLADQVLTFRRRGNESGPPDLGVVIEVQLQKDEEKERTWPAYIANAVKQLGCEVLRLVVTDQPSIAEWAKGPFGTSQMHLYPAVICLSELPQPSSSLDALQIPELPMLRALSNPEDSSFGAVLTALDGIATDLQGLSLHVLSRIKKEESMQTGNVYLDRELAKPWVVKAMDEAQVKVELCETLEGEAQRKARIEAMLAVQMPYQLAKYRARRTEEEEALPELRSSALELLQSKLPQVTERQKVGIRTFHHVRKLASLVLDLIRATNPAEVLAALDKVRIG